MASCPKCGTKNDDNAAFCTHCGISLQADLGSTIERHAKQFAKDMEQVGKKAGERMVQTAKQIHDNTQKSTRHFEKRIDRVSRRAENWYDQTFGIFGPLLASFIFLIVFRLAIAVMEIPSEETPEINTLAVILLVYVLPLFAVTLLSNYTKYFARKFFQFKVFSPLLYAITVVLLLWIISRILYDTSVRFSIINLGSAAVSLENNLPTIFIFVLLLGYVILVMNMPREEEKKP
jgi:membrane-associated HD superfamily phosphohydrolase